jgi:hypothetical protein
MYTCQICGFKVKDLGQMNRHYGDKHPERYKKASATHKRHVREKKEQLEAALKDKDNNNNKLSGYDILQMLKVKRDALNEVIANMEKMLK